MFRTKWDLSLLFSGVILLEFVVGLEVLIEAASSEMNLWVIIIFCRVLRFIALMLEKIRISFGNLRPT